MTSTNMNDNIQRATSPIPVPINAGPDPIQLSRNNDANLQDILSSLFQAITHLSSDKLSNEKRRQLHRELHTFNDNTINNALQGHKRESIETLTFENKDQKYIRAPDTARIYPIHELRTIVPTAASRDLNSQFPEKLDYDTRRRDTTLGLRLVDLLNTITQVSEDHKLSSEATITLLKRSLEGRARLFLYNLCEHISDLKEIYKSLIDFFHSEPNSWTAQSQLKELVNKPITDVVCFLQDVFNTSFAATNGQNRETRTISAYLLAEQTLKTMIEEKYPDLYNRILAEYSIASRNNYPSNALESAKRQFDILSNLIRRHKEMIENRNMYARKQGRIHAIEDEDTGLPSDNSPGRDETGIYANNYRNENGRMVNRPPERPLQYNPRARDIRVIPQPSNLMQRFNNNPRQTIGVRRNPIQQTGFRWQNNNNYDNSRNNNNGNQRFPRTRSCYLCGMENHNWYTCQKYKNERPQMTPCYECKKNGKTLFHKYCKKAQTTNSVNAIQEKSFFNSYPKNF